MVGNDLAVQTGVGLSTLKPALESVVNVMSVMSPWRVLCIRKMNIAGIVGGKDRKTAQPLVVVGNALRI